MELQILNAEHSNGQQFTNPRRNLQSLDKPSPFIEANTIAMHIDSIKREHVIPVFAKDNVPAISQVEFIEATKEIAIKHLGNQKSNLSIRVSHPIKGRAFEARLKKAEDLADSEKTIYFERMAFVLEFPGIREIVNGNELILCVAGVKSYNLDNLYNHGGARQSFKVALGFQVKVCTNLCLWSDGTILDIKARSLDELHQCLEDLFNKQALKRQLGLLALLADYELKESQFASLLGRARMYSFLPIAQRKEVAELYISDSQISTVVKQYYSSKSFSKNPDGSINMWKLYNLFTDAVKSSYIDTFLDRNVNAYTFSNGICKALEGKGDYQWFLG